MKKIIFFSGLAIALIALSCLLVSSRQAPESIESLSSSYRHVQPTAKAQTVSLPVAVEKNESLTPVTLKPIPDYLTKSIEWLAQSQAADGGWGANQVMNGGTGSYRGRGLRMDIEERPAPQIAIPPVVKGDVETDDVISNNAPLPQTDPATTAFSALALARAGSSLTEGPHASHLQKALKYLLTVVEQTPPNAQNITALTNTQPQRKLGRNVDVSISMQFFTRILHEGVGDKAMKKRINRAIDKCIGMLQDAQQADGSWGASGWAPVLNSVMANNALEMSQLVGKDVDVVLDQSRAYQQKNMDKSGNVKTEKAAGIALYSLSSTQRATAKDASEAEKAIQEASGENVGTLSPENEEANYKILSKTYTEKKAKRLAESYRANAAAKAQLNNDAVLTGFGNNGGEEYLSYMMTAESFVAEGNQKSWDNWHKKMAGLFDKVQNGNGSWTGQHCITSPVFCTAAVIMTLTADRDAELLMARK